MSETKKRSIIGYIFSILNGLSVAMSLFFCLFFVGGCMILVSLLNTGSLNSVRSNVHKDSILVLRLEGVILDPSDFLEDLNKYMEHKKIKGVLVRVNSPGGGTAASQEIYEEIQRLKALHKKPVVFSIGSLGASGAFYVSMAGDKIIANGASLLGSIGVIIYLSNLEKLYDWAKIENYVIKTGEFKDSGTNFRPITNRERDLFQDLIEQFQSHFKEVIVKDRKVSKDLVEEFSDGRVFSGSTALVQGFIDQTGTYYDALNVIGEMTGLGSNPEVFEPIKHSDRWKEFLTNSIQKMFPWATLPSSVWSPQLQHRPLYLMPRYTIGN